MAWAGPSTASSDARRSRRSWPIGVRGDMPEALPKLRSRQCPSSSPSSTARSATSCSTAPTSATPSTASWSPRSARRCAPPPPTPPSHCVVIRGAGPMFSSGHGPRLARRAGREPRQPARVPQDDPRRLEPRRGDGEADDLRHPRRLHRRRDGARARLRPARDGQGRGDRHARDADRPDPRRRRLLAAAAGGRARPRQGAGDDRQDDQRRRGRADRARQPRGDDRRSSARRRRS